MSMNDSINCYLFYCIFIKNYDSTIADCPPVQFIQHFLNLFPINIVCSCTSSINFLSPSLSLSPSLPPSLPPSLFPSLSPSLSPLIMCRAAVTGEGHFYFIGPQIVHFFQILKERIEILSLSSNNAFSPSSSRKKPDNSYSTRRKPSDHSFSGSVDYTPMSTSSPEDPDGHQGDSPSSTGESSGDPYPFRAPLPPPPLSPPIVPASHKLPAIPPVSAPLSPAPSIPEFSEAGHYPLSKSVSMSSDYQSLQHSTRQRPSEYESVSLTTKPSFRMNSLQ